MPTLPSYSIRRLEDLGARALHPREILALLLGGENADLIAQRVMEHCRSDSEALFRRLAQCTLSELARIPGVGDEGAARLCAASDLCRRAAEEARPERPRMRTGRDIYEHMRMRLRDLAHEEFHVLLLNAQNEVMRDVLVSKGTADASLAHPREIFRTAILEAATTVVLVHNHPSGEPCPSPEDRAVTRALHAVGETIGIPVLDHVIIGEGRYVSFQEAGLLGDGPPVQLVA